MIVWLIRTISYVKFFFKKNIYQANPALWMIPEK